MRSKINCVEVELRETIYILTGPTAVGKTQLALDWALAFDAEIVSCDSLLFYRGMDIGTAKPTGSERSRVVHHCIDLVEPSQQFRISAFLEVAAAAVSDILSRGKRVLVTGGSGFYLKGFVSPVVDAIQIPPSVHDGVERLRAEGGLPALVEALRLASPGDWDQIDLCNERRVIPALKRCLATGKGIGALRQQAIACDFPFAGFAVQSVLLQRPIAQLQERIAMRTHGMLEAGLLDEVKALIERGFEANPSACQSIGYRESLAFLKGEIPYEQMVTAIHQNTLKLVKKQTKWFRHQMQFDRTVDLGTGGIGADALFDLGR